MITSLIVNARVRTDDPHRPWADAVALDDESRVVCVGSSAALRKRAPAGARIVDAAGAHVTLLDGRAIIDASSR